MMYTHSVSRPTSAEAKESAEETAANLRASGKVVTPGAPYVVVAASSKYGWTAIDLTVDDAPPVAEVTPEPDPPPSDEEQPAVAEAPAEVLVVEEVPEVVEDEPPPPSTSKSQGKKHAKPWQKPR